MKRTAAPYRELPEKWQHRFHGWAEISLNLNRKLSQTTDVVRWGDHHRRGLRIPVQTVPDHIRGLNHLKSMFIRFMQKYDLRPFDVLLLSDCVDHHDLPELLLKNRRHSAFDKSEPRKTDDDDLQENAAHQAAFILSSVEAQVHYRRAYLLQAVAKLGETNKKFLARLDQSDQRVIAYLRQNNLPEARLFTALENFEYIVYSAFCTMQDKPVYDVIRDVAPRSVPVLDQLAEQIPGFKETIWTPSMRDWCTQFIPKVQ